MANFLSDFEDKVKFVPEPFYNPSGDCIHFQTTDESVYGDRMDSYLTLYRSMENDSVVGFQVKGITAILKKFGANQMTVQAGAEGQTISVITIVVGALKSVPEEIPSQEDLNALFDLLATIREKQAQVRVPKLTA